MIEKKLEGLTEHEIYKLPKYLFVCVGKESDGCNQKIRELNSYIKNKYCKNYEVSGSQYNKILRYVNNTPMMCSKEGLSSLNYYYLVKQIESKKNNVFIVMDKNDNIIHSIITYYYDVKDDILYIPALCVNQVEGASRGYILMDILKSACRYAGIKNIMLDSLQASVGFYRKQGFSSNEKFPDAEYMLKRMTLKKDLTPYNSNDKLFKSIFNSKSSSFYTDSKHSSISSNNVFPDVVKEDVVKEDVGSPKSKGKMSILELSVDKNTVKQFEPITEPKIKNIMTNFENEKRKVHNRTLIDLEKDKEYILFENDLYVNKMNTTKSLKRTTKKRKASHPVSTRTRSSRIHYPVSSNTRLAKRLRTQKNKNTKK